MEHVKAVAIILLLFSTTILRSQDLEFSQFFNSPLYTNPAFAGVDFGPRFALNYRNQWAGLGNAFISYAVSYDQHFDALNGGVGVLITSDRQGNGLYISNQVSGIYSYQFNITRRLVMKAGAQVSLAQRRIKLDELVFAENINPNDGTLLPSLSSDLPDNSSRFFPDFGAGFLLYTRKFFWGMSAKHVTAPNESLTSTQSSPLPMRWAVNAGLEFKSDKRTGTRTYFTPYAFYAQQAKFRQLTGGAILGIGVFYGGLSFRSNFSNSDAVILLAGIQKGVFRFGYSFDATVSSLQGEASGTHELALLINVHDSEKIKFSRSQRKSTTCPDIF